MLPPMNSGETISASSVNWVVTLQTQAGDGIFDHFSADINLTMGISSIFEVGKSSPHFYDDMSRKDLIHIALNLGMDHKKVKKSNKLQLAKDIKATMQKRGPIYRHVI